MTPAIVALGSNVGDPLLNLKRAIAALSNDFAVGEKSAVYRTDPMYVVDQPPFLNAAVQVETDFGPRETLALLKKIESELGRLDEVRYGPRVIDLDLITFGSLAYSFEEGDRSLLVPHPKVVERRFVLQPLYDIAPTLNLVGLGNVADLLQRTNSDADAVVKVSDAAI